MKRWSVVPLLALAALSAGCTRLGPLPAVSGASAVPAEQPDVELSAGFIPGFYLSDAVQQSPDDALIGQVSGLFEPGELIDLPGLAAGGRFVSGEEGDGYFEPMARYRLWIDGEQRVGLAVVGYGTHASGENEGASYSMTRGGLELGIDVRLTPTSEWAELHALTGASLMGLWADGSYCMDTQTGFGRTCDDGELANARAEIADALPAFFSGVALDFARHLNSPFHGARIVAWFGGGMMPVVAFEEEKDQRGWAQGGLGLSLSFGGS